MKDAETFYRIRRVSILIRKYETYCGSVRRFYSHWLNTFVCRTAVSCLSLIKS
jgi:hypothetical protein